jgi:hypothetical protein
MSRKRNAINIIFWNKNVELRCSVCFPIDFKKRRACPNKLSEINGDFQLAWRFFWPIRHYLFCEISNTQNNSKSKYHKNRVISLIIYKNMQNWSQFFFSYFVEEDKSWVKLFVYFQIEIKLPSSNGMHKRLPSSYISVRKESRAFYGLF